MLDHKSSELANVLQNYRGALNIVKNNSSVFIRKLNSNKN